ncbi:MAG: SoxR reducing system RseC family protein [Planctomycetota bacterium]
MNRFREKGIVRGVEGGQAVIVVEPADKASCGGCCACGLGANPELRLPAEGEIREGDEVTLEVITPSRVVSALLVFALPFAGLLVGYSAARAALFVLHVGAGTAGNWITGLAAIAGFVASFLVAAWYDRRWRAVHGQPIRIVEVRHPSR